MSIIEELRRITKDRSLQWATSYTVCPYVCFEINGIKHTLLRRSKGYQLNVEGMPRTPAHITDPWPVIKKRLLSKIGSLIVK